MLNFIHPRLMAHLSARGANSAYPNAITVQTSTRTYHADTNEPIETLADDAVMVDLPAYIEPIDAKMEIRRSDQTIVQNGFRIAIAGFYTLTEGQTLVDESDNAYNIIMVSNDAFQTQTNVIAEIINTAIATE